MNVVIFGTGGIGGFIAGKLGSLLKNPRSGLDSLSIVARGDHLQAIQSKGLVYRDPDNNERTVFPSLATDVPGRLPWADLIFLCVKGYDLDNAVRAVERIVRNDTIILPLLNGADIYDRVRERLPKGFILPGAIYISSSIVSPGVVAHTGGKGLIITGPEPGTESGKYLELLDLLSSADIPCQWNADPLPPVWEKYVFIAPFCMITGVTGRSIGEVCEDPQLNRDVRGMIEETAAVAAAAGVELSADIADRTMKKAEGFPRDTRTSFQRDIEKHREKDERDLFGGTVIRMGKKLGVDTPVTERYNNLLP